MSNAHVALEFERDNDDFARPSNGSLVGVEPAGFHWLHPPFRGTL